MASEPHHPRTDDETPEVRNPVEARQGFLDRPVVVVMVVSIVLLLVGYAVIIGFW